MTERPTDEALTLMAGGSKPGSVGLDYDEALTSMARELLAHRRATPADDLRDRIARIVTLDHLRLLQDFDVDGDLYRLDPECAESARVTADAIITALSQPADDLRAGHTGNENFNNKDPKDHAIRSAARIIAHRAVKTPDGWFAPQEQWVKDFKGQVTGGRIGRPALVLAPVTWMPKVLGDAVTIEIERLDRADLSQKGGA